MLHAEKKCWKFAMGKVEYSPIIAETRLRRWLWQKIVQKKLGQKVSGNLLWRTARKCSISNPFCTMLEEAQQKYEECDKEYAQLKKRAPELRHEFLCSRASNASGDVEPESQKAAQRQLRTERQRREARHLRQVLGNASGSAISRIEIAHGDGVEEVCAQADVE
jgi:hypothetical protein